MVSIQALQQKIKTVSIAELSAVSGVKRTTIVDIRDGRTRNPGILTIEQLGLGLKKLLRRSRTAKKRSRGAVA